MQAVLQPFQTVIDQAIHIIQQDAEAIGLAAGGSWISGDIDAYSDLDLVLVTTNPVAPDLESMRAWAARIGTMLASFRGDHVGEPRLLIALYADPLLHVDIKFLTLAEFYHRVEDPVILWERDQQLSAVLSQSMASYPTFDYQGMEDRFWIWIHYALLKVGRGEYFEALDFIAFVRNVVIGPLLHLKNGNLPRGVRRVETTISANDLANLKKTVAMPERNSLLASLVEVIRLYVGLRDQLAPPTLQKNNAAKEAINEYFAVIQTTAITEVNE
ncbi:nucleotidyltransferase domain-containing protein [Spirosoma sp. KUDC1026]|uniref:nucleotidyltransferase domain-containing protein n=1 Tax=Spirosoma sp. KUDC1026 TaxID=2745947 RepID=UPI00159BB2EF|nr:nucleotidyltransferase domain-containing protein [Spirosoma sp. KUDC1026]QKZ13330.1 nucleotidyltransferase domain-containing protein [Spirosoma sp. KUDC1026]